MNTEVFAILIFLLTSAAIPILVDEFADWLPWIAKRLILQAARRLPTSSADRYQEEWIAELAALPGGKLNQLRFGISIILGSYSLRKALRTAEHGEIAETQYMSQLTPLEFEHLVRKLFVALGYRAHSSILTGDSGVDLALHDDDPIFGGITVVQVKRSNRAADVSTAHKLLGAVSHHGANRALLISTSSFTQSSHELAERHPHLSLIDGIELKRLLAEHLGVDLRSAPPGNP